MADLSSVATLEGIPLQNDSEKQIKTRSRVRRLCHPRRLFELFSCCYVFFWCRCEVLYIFLILTRSSAPSALALKALGSPVT